MKPVNRLITLLSLITVVITVERVSPTTRILLQPYGFLHLHEALQIGLITAAGTVISFLILREVSDGFRLLAAGGGAALGCLFILGTYFAASGNAAHEVASFLFNRFCDVHHVRPGACGSEYVNDYFFGNVTYFVGVGLVSTVVFALVFGGLLLTARARPRFLPFTLYSGLGFTLAAVIAIPIRALR